MAQLLGGTLLIALLHALIPNHWLPLVAVAKAERWKASSLYRIALLAALAHVLGTATLGVLLGQLSHALATQFERYVHWFGSAVLVLFGLYYMRSKHRHTPYRAESVAAKTPRRRWIWFFAAMMFLSPCLEVQSLFISAGAFGMKYTLIMAGLYCLISISGILFLVVTANRGLKLISPHFLEHFEKQITGSILVAVGVLTFFLH